MLNTVLDTIKVGTANLKKSSNSIFDYFCISYDYKMQNVKIEKPNDFYKLWLETTGKMFADEKTTYDSPKQGDTEKYNFKTLNKLLLDKLNNSELSFAIYTEIQKINLPVLFRNVNDGVPLNGQQIRQSYPSKIAQYVRDKRNTFEKSLKNFVKNKEFIVLKADEFIAKCIAYAAYNTTDKKTLDRV